MQLACGSSQDAAKSNQAVSLPTKLRLKKLPLENSLSTDETSIDLLQAYESEVRTALTIRMTEQRLLELFSEGKLFGTVHTGIGQEFTGVAVSKSLQPADTVFSNHRCHGHFIAYCGNVEGLIAEIMGRQLGVCGGRGGSQHLQQDRFFSNGILGGTVPISTGLAFGHKLRQTGGIAVVYIGDGALGEGVIYESFNIASKWDLPILFVCENNSIAQSTPQQQTLAGSITARAEAFDIKSSRGDTWDWAGLIKQVELITQEMRSTSRPHFLQVDTYRLMAHSKGDDTRPEEEVEPYRQRDPLNQLAQQYQQDPRWKAMVSEIESKIDSAVEKADASPFCQAPAATDNVEELTTWSSPQFQRERIVTSVRRGLEEAMQADDRVVIIGEDIESPYGGAFKCTAGLSDQFPDRVRNTPISEGAIMGVGNGLSLSDMRPVVEIMFGDFLTLATDQWINHAGKFAWMYNDQVQMPVVVRTPMGGKRGYAATHSQSLEKHFLGLPGTQVLCLHHRICPADLYRDLLNTIDRPTLVVENKTMYGQYADPQPPAGFQLDHSNNTFPTARLSTNESPDLTMVVLGGLSAEAEAAAIELFEEEEIVTDLFFPTQLYPFDVGFLEESLTASRRLLVIEEGQGFVSWSSEVVAQTSERFGQLGLQCCRLASAPIPIPAARPFEEQCLVGKTTIITTAMEMLSELVH